MNSFWHNYWNFLEPWRSRLLRLTWWIAAMQLLALAEPAIVMTIVDDIVKHGRGAEDRIWVRTAVGAVTLLLIGLVKVAKDLRIFRVNSSLYRDVQVLCYEKLLRLPMQYFQRTNAGEMMGKVTRGTGKIMDITNFLLFEIVPLVIQTTLSLIVLLYLRPVTTLALLPAAIAFSWLTHRLKRGTQSSRRQRHDCDSKADALNGQAMANIATVLSFNQQAFEAARSVALRNTHQHLFLSEVALINRTEIIRNGLVSVGRMSMIVLCAYAVFGNVVTVGTMILMVTLAERIFISLYRLGGIYDRVMDAEEPVQKILDLMSESEVMPDPREPLSLPSRKAREIVLKEVSFAYPSTSQSQGSDELKMVLHNIHLTIKPGQMLGIVGHSGCGKSTLASLLLGFYRPLTGTIAFDGVDIRHLRVSDVRDSIGLVSQDVDLFNDSISENIRYGTPDATDEDIVEAAKLAHAHDFIMTTEQGYETKVGTRGLRLSGGQRQRIGIARALLRKPPILLFDEATSAVDPETIWEIKQAITKLRGSCTMIVISHQLSTIQDAHNIVVMHQGRVVGMGTHRELLQQRNPTYCSLVKHQTQLDEGLHLSTRGSMLS